MSQVASTPSGQLSFPQDRPERSVCTANTNSDAPAPPDTRYLAAVLPLPAANETFDRNRQRRHIALAQ